MVGTPGLWREVKAFGGRYARIGVVTEAAGDKRTHIVREARRPQPQGQPGASPATTSSAWIVAHVAAFACISIAQQPDVAFHI